MSKSESRDLAQSESRGKSEHKDDVSIFLLLPSKARSDILNIAALIRDLQMNENSSGSCQILALSRD